MKKLLCAVIAFVMLLSLAGCKNDEDILIPAPDVIEQTDETKTEVQDIEENIEENEENAENDVAEGQNENESDLTGESKTEYYTLTPMLIEDVADDEHNRKIRLYQLDTDSACKEAINETIFSGFSELLDAYMDSAPVFFQNLVIDTAFADDGNILCIAVLGKLSRTSIMPLYSEFVYWDYKNDKLLSLREYAESAGLSLDSVGTRTDEYIGQLGNGSYKSRFEFNIEGVFSWQDDKIFVITISPKEEYKDQTSGSFTVFYSCKQDAVYSGGLFDGGFDGFGTGETEDK